MSDPDASETAGAKAALRTEMRRARRQLDNRAARSTRIWAQVRELPAVRAARTIMVFDSIQGEPDTEAFIEWCRAVGKTIVLPEDDPPPDPGSPDAVIVPGVAFTRDGHRLGQGGGWFDRFLAQVRPDCTSIGVGFDPQLVENLPTEPHDVTLDVVVTESGVARPVERPVEPQRR